MRAMVRKGSLDSNLDILRSLAVLTVFATHTLQVIAGHKFGEHFAYGVETYSLGRIGVLIFFVHTSVLSQKFAYKSGRSFLGWSRRLRTTRRAWSSGCDESDSRG
jgi:peptidoglycan/LPS O-acetylase OafA/YrhL